jgi:hypothetical protein
MDNINNTPKTSSRLTAVFVKPFQYEAFGAVHTLEAGSRWKVVKLWGFVTLVNGVLTIVAGHGAVFPVPEEYYTLERVV